MPIDQLIDIDDHRLGLIFMRFIFSQDFQKYGLFVHFNDENCDKIAVLSVRFEVGVSLLLAPAGADKRGSKAPFPLVENAGIQPVICKRVPAGAPAGAGSY